MNIRVVYANFNFSQKHMDFSVVIPVHNEEENIGDLINEITFSLSEKYQHEIIVVDDGSTDNTLDVLLKIKKNLSTLRVVKHLQNSGQSTAVRTGFNMQNQPG